jgi:hypothetical protein
MAKLTLTATLALGREYYAAAMQVEDPFIQAFDPLRVSDDPFIASIVGDEVQAAPAVRTVMKLRKDAAEKIAAILTERILESMATSDTINGYPISIEEN